MSRTNESNAFRSSTLTKAAACICLAVSTCIPAFAAGADNPTPVMQQQKTVTIHGTVKDTHGEALVGVSVLEKGTTNGAATNLNGQFTLNVKGSSSVLVVSYVGYQGKEITVGSQRQLTIILQEESEVLKDAVVIGYGTQRKGDVTSAIASVKAEDFTTGNIGDAGQLIKGKVAGLSITKGNGDPNEESAIRLRGVISLLGDNTPLVLIDGVEGDLTSVAPEDIASIDVLKDASAAAIYGTRGANGVIIITTNTGRRETPAKVTYSGYVTMSGFQTTDLGFMTAEDIRNGLNNSLSDLGYETDWVKEISRTAWTHNHNLSVSGGTKSTTYAASATYRNDQGVIKNTFGRDFRLRANISQYFLGDILKASFDIQHKVHLNSATKASEDSYSNIFHQAITYNPTAPVYNEDGSYYENLGANYYYNPVEIINEYLGETRINNTRMNGSLTAEPIKGWKTMVSLGTVFNNVHGATYRTSDYYSNKSAGYTGSASQSLSAYRSYNLEVTSNYKKTFDKHRLDVLVGYSWKKDISQGFSASNVNFPSDFFLYNNLELGSGLKTKEASMSSYKNISKLVGFFGRISYGYDDRYNVLLSVRREGSSKFGDNHKWGTFPSASFRWNASNEAFLKDVSWLDELSLRAGYGVTGVIPTDSYLSLTKYTFGGSYYYDEGSWKPGLSISSNPNPDIKWEKSGEFNVGLDWSVLGGRLGGSIDFYNKTTKDLLWEYAVPTPPNLYEYTTANVGTIRNRGIEVTLNAIPVRTKAFQWKITATASHNSNKVISLENDLYEMSDPFIETGYITGISIASHRWQEGQPIDRYYGLKSVGISENGLYLIENPTTGEVQEWEASMNTSSEWMQYIGHGLPKVYASLQNTFTYKGFDLSIMLTGQFGFDILNENRWLYENETYAFNRMKSVKTPYGGNTLSVNQTKTFVSYYLEKGDFVKISNITLGYTYKLKPNKYLNSVRAYLSADNLYTFTGYSGLDPELTNANIGSLGNDYHDTYPPIRSFTLGVNIEFGTNEARSQEPVVYVPVEKEVVKEVPVEKKVVEKVEKLVPDTHVVTFAVNSSEIGDKSELDRIPEGSEVEVVAYASPEGNADANLALSQRRADAVADYLKSKGIKVTRVAAKGADTEHSNRIAIVTVK